VLLSIRNMGGESTAAWREFLGDLDARGLQGPDFVIVDGAPGLEPALVALRGEELPIQRCPAAACHSEERVRTTRRPTGQRHSVRFAPHPHCPEMKTDGVSAIAGPPPAAGGQTR